MSTFWTAMQKSPYAVPEDEWWRSLRLPPPQLTGPVVEARAEREALFSRSLKKSGHPRFLRFRDPDPPK